LLLYVPLDPDFPTDRLRYMLETAAIKIMVTETSLLNVVGDYSCQRVCLDQEPATDTSAVLNSSKAANISSNLAYVIFTSGSTGKPKGVQVQHSAVTNFLYSMINQPGFNSDDRLLAVTTLSFDIAVLELYLPLLVGGTTVIATKEIINDGSKLAETITEKAITTMQATPSTWRLLLSSGWQGNDNLKVLCGGEALPADLVPELLPRVGQMWNMYGPTETTVWSTCYRITADDETILIGKPIGNTQCYVLDKYGQPVPIGVPGELYIGGDGVTLGYLKQEALTAEQYVTNPQTPEKKMYNTGDLVRWRESGDLEYLKRIDNQVKIRGFRIELGEIESVLGKHDSVSEVVAVVRELQAGDQRLIVYVVLIDGSEMTATEMRNFLRQKLPNYMLPQHFVELDTMPLTPNGKINHKALSQASYNFGQQDRSKPPGTDIEKAIGVIWCELLQIEKVSIDDNFFDLGGHSLLAMKLIYKIHERYNVNITLFDIIANSLDRISATVANDYIQEEHTQEVLSTTERADEKTGLLNRLSRLFGK